MQDLIVLSDEAFAQLKRELKAVGLDVCYRAESARPIRMRWTPARLTDAAFLQQVALTGRMSPHSGKAIGLQFQTHR